MTICFSLKGTTENTDYLLLFRAQALLASVSGKQQTNYLLRFRAGSPRFGFGRATKYLLRFRASSILATLSGKQHGIPASAYREGQLYTVRGKKKKEEEDKCTEL